MLAEVNMSFFKLLVLHLRVHRHYQYADKQINQKYGYQDSDYA